MFTMQSWLSHKNTILYTLYEFSQVLNENHPERFYFIYKSLAKSTLSIQFQPKRKTFTRV